MASQAEDKVGESPPFPEFCKISRKHSPERSYVHSEASNSGSTSMAKCYAFYGVRGSVWKSGSPSSFFNAGKSTIKLKRHTGPNTPKLIRPPVKTGLLENSTGDPDFRARVAKRCEAENGISKIYLVSVLFPRGSMLLQ